MIAVLFVFYGGVSLFNSINALRRPVEPGSSFPPLWLPGMLISELAPAVFVSRVAVSGLALATGAAEGRAGALGLSLLAAAQVVLLPQFVRTFRARRQVGGPLAPAEGWRGRVIGRPDVPPDIEVLSGIPYHDDLTLDIYRRRDHSGPSPTLMYVHGGSWRGGDPHNVARPLFHALSREGWVVATIRYPLSPEATFPDHLVGVKRAVAWARTRGTEHGIDGARIAIAGGSAGGHLAALTALTANRPGLQPGFEEEDTSVAACVPMYAIYDFFNRHRTRWDWPLIHRDVMKARHHEDPDRYALASPLDQVGPHAPPFLVIHGANDSLVPPPEAHVFVEALRRTSGAPVEYLEVIGAQHAFDAISSIRTRAVTSKIQAFLHTHVVLSHESR